MALRLFLMGVVASLALDLPFGGTDPKPTARAGRSWLDANVMGRDDASRTVVMVSEPKPSESRAIPVPEPTPVPTKPPAVAEETATTVRTIATIETKTEDVAPAMILPGRAEAAAMAAAAEPPAATDAPEDAAPPLMPPAPEVADAQPKPVVEEVPALESPISVVVTDPMAPPSAPGEAAPAPIPAPEPAPIAVAETPKAADPDAEFAGIVGGMASSFAADFATPPAGEPKPLLAQVETVPPPAPAAEDLNFAAVENLYPGLAFALNRESEGLIPVVVPAPAPARPEPAPVAEAVIDPSRAERLAQAVKLTGQAVHAWASLLGQRPSVTSLQR